ncbi:MAG: hypothetical protein EBU49_05095 [Proteobacteria bacterium]|nr:hypothetical protein [Pseudomonadota bacterium]
MHTGNDAMLWVFFNGGNYFSHECNRFMFSPAFSFDGGLDRQVLEGHVTMASSSRAAASLNI